MRIVITLLLLVLSCSTNLQREKEDTLPNITHINNQNIPFDSKHHSSIQNMQLHLDKYSKIKHGMMIDPIPSFEPFTAPSPSLRTLAEQNTFTRKTGFVPIDNENQKNTYWMQRTILTTLSATKSSMLIYPYKFSYTDENDTTIEYPIGGYFTVAPDEFFKNNYAPNFNHSTLNKQIQLGKAKALYDSDIAILKIKAKFEDTVMDLFYESDYYCTYLVNFIGKSATCYYGKDDLLKFKKESPLKTGVVFLNHTEILNNALFSEDKTTNFFSTLIIPDHALGSHDLINELLTKDGINAIKKFISNGGNVIVSGKSGYLFETWGLFAKGTYITDKLLTTNVTEPETYINVDDPTGQTPDTSPDFDKQVLTMQIQNVVFLLSSYPMKYIASNNFQYYANYTGHKSMCYKDAVSGVLSVIEDKDKEFMPFLMKKEYNKGKIILLNGNPLFKTSHTNLPYNCIIYTLLRNVLFNAYLNVGNENALPIPGGEGGIKTSATVEFYNLFTSPVSNFELDVFLPNKVVFSPVSSGCSESSDIVKGVELDSTKFNMTSHMKCTITSLAQFEKFTKEIKVEILDASVTQQSTDITIMYPVIRYMDTQSQITYLLDYKGIKTQAALGAILRGAINPDPSSMYPFPGRGYPADTVLQVENKENTVARDVVYYGVIPLISPLVDGSNQAAVAISMEFYNKYYTSKVTEGSNNYYVPFTETTQNEYIDFQELSGKDVILGADWDQPVKISKELRGEHFTTDYGVTKLDIGNINYSTQIDDINLTLQQMCFKDSSKFFELATQRLMPYVDTTKEAGAKLYYGDTIPPDIADPSNPKRAKKNLIFSRNDVYFYDSSGDYQMPTGIDETFVISIDKYPHSERPCETTFGKADVVQQKNGTFTHTEGLIPNEWENQLFRTCGRTQYDPTKPEELEKLGPDVNFIHYLVPVVDEEITRAGNIVGFEEDNAEGTFGHFKQYDVLKFIYAYGTTFLIAASDSRQGGKLVFSLPNGVRWANNEDPIEKGYITFSADQVAFYKTEIINGEIITYFKRGLMPNEAYGKDSTIGIAIENLSSTLKSFSIDIKLYEVKYDISSPATNYEHYESRKTYPVTFNYVPYFSLPAIEIANRMERNDSTEIKEYELLMPYTRYGVYQQELVAHRTVYGYLEIHNVKDPGLVSPSAGFGTISNIGTSSIPFVEYVTHGSKLLIPNAPRTSRLEWIDIWGRHWAQPLRSVFPDIPPIPPPLKNFMMSTSYELIAKNGKDRLQEWPSDEEAYVHIQMKFLNNFPKFFLSTNCRENVYPYYKTDVFNFKNDRVFTKEPDFEYITDEAAMKESDKLVAFGFSSVYGKCYKKEGSILQGQTLQQEDFDLMDKAMTCSESANQEKMKQCLEELKTVKTLTKRKDDKTTGKDWIYSPSVDTFYPKGYIKDNMWDLTHYDYDDNAMDKAYRYHCDNNLPSLDVCPPQNPAVYKPHNVVAFPLFKGFGYQMIYSNQLTFNKFSKYKGWWSDNLQNMDNTLLAGQTVSNDVSVGKKTLLPDNKWINWRDLVSPLNDKIIPTRLKNIYTCLFNQHRIKIQPGQQIYAFPDNVYQNNVVPIIPDLDSEDKRLTEYPCTEEIYQYSPTNISLVDNIVKTVTDRDWLYFAINLRGGAKENINILMKLSPFQDNQYEGITKVQDGGRFVYWNPVNGPNSFLMVDNPVNTIEASRVDLTMDGIVIPTSITTFNAVVYHIYSIEDKNEYLREFTQKTYSNSYGYGDSAATVYVGGTLDTSCKLNPGETTIVKIVLINNSGFDWNMYGKAMDFQEKESMAINAQDLLTGKVHTIRVPTKYHFLTFEVPDELTGHVSIIPSDHNEKTAPQFFDFQNINVATIRDGFEGDYFVKLTVSTNFPENLRGRLLSIKVKLNYEFFDNLPSPTDPTGVHDYTLEIPPIKFGVVYPPEHQYAGKIFYTFGRAHDLVSSNRIFPNFNVEGARFITQDIVEEMKAATGDPKNVYSTLNKIWDTKLAQTTPIKFDTTFNDGVKIMNVYFNETIYATFPKENPGQPDTTSFSFAVKTTAKQVDIDYQPMIYYYSLNYKNWRETPKKYLKWNSRFASAKGAWLKVSYSYAVVVKDSNDKYVRAVDQRVFPTDSGVLQVNITAKNTGSDVSYHTKFELYFEDGITFLTQCFNSNYKYVLKKDSLELQSDLKILNTESFTEVLYFEFYPQTTTGRRLATASSRTIIKKLTASLDLTETQGEVTVTQEVNTPFIVYYPDAGISRRETLALNIVNSGNYLVPVFTLTAVPDPSTTITGKNVRFKYYRMIKGIDKELQNITDIIDSNTYVDTPLSEEQTKDLESYSVSYRVESYDENEKFLASSAIIYETKIPSGEEKEIKKKGTAKLPLWAIVLISVLGASILIVSGFIIYRALKRKDKSKFEHLTHETEMSNSISVHK